jgi:hypothetical protein
MSESLVVELAVVVDPMVVDSEDRLNLLMAAAASVELQHTLVVDMEEVVEATATPLEAVAAAANPGGKFGLDDVSLFLFDHLSDHLSARS